MNRKEFIKTCGMTCVGGAALATLLESCSPVYYATSSLNGKVVTINRSEFVYVKKEQTLQRKFVLVQHDALKFPICVYRFSDTDMLALSMECTHQGCELHAHDTGFNCPCHGSEFDDHGMVTNPPAEEPLDRFAIHTDETTVYVTLS